MSGGAPPILDALLALAGPGAFQTPSAALEADAVVRDRNACGAILDGLSEVTAGLTTLATTCVAHGETNPDEFAGALCDVHALQRLVKDHMDWCERRAVALGRQLHAEHARMVDEARREAGRGRSEPAAEENPNADLLAELEREDMKAAADGRE